jgi:C4-dicarboxylate transporter DctM subunit
VASHIFGVVPLFVLTGFLVAHADVGKDAFEVAQPGFRRLRGGLGVATVAANAVFAAITGISIASAAVFTRVAVPQMLRFGYQPRFAVGVVAGSSVLGMLIPPSLLMILYGFLSNQSVGDLFTAGIVPGLLLALAYALGIVLMAHLRPEHGVPAAPTGQEDDEPHATDAAGCAAAQAAAGVLMIVLVLGGLYAGLFTATEAGAVGAALALADCAAAPQAQRPQPVGVLTETGHVTVAVSFPDHLRQHLHPHAGHVGHAAVPGRDHGRRRGSGATVFLLLYVLIVIAGHGDRLVVDPADRAAADAADGRAVRHEPGLVRRHHGGGGRDRAADTALRPVGAYVIKSTLGNDPRISLGDIFRGTAPFTLMMLGCCCCWSPSRR